jgi:hypothetical protein
VDLGRVADQSRGHRAVFFLDLETEEYGVGIWSRVLIIDNRLVTDEDLTPYLFHGQIVIAIGRARKAVHSTIKIWGRTKAERSQLRHELKDMSVLRA